MRFEWIQDILRRASEEENVPLKEVERIWDYNEKALGGYAHDEFAPVVIFNGWFKLVPDERKISNEIFRQLHACRKSTSPGLNYRYRINLVRLLRIRSRVVEEMQTYKDYYQNNLGGGKYMGHREKPERKRTDLEEKYNIKY